MNRSVHAGMMTSRDVQCMKSRFEQLGYCKFDEAVLDRGESKNWLEAVQFLCTRLQQGQSASKLLSEVTQLGHATSKLTLHTDVAKPVSPVQEMQAALDLMCIEASESDIKGAGSVQDRLGFLEKLLTIAEHLDVTSRGDRLLASVARDCTLLSTGIASAPDFSWEPARLFRRYPELQEAMGSLPKRTEAEQQSLFQARLKETNDAIVQEELRRQRSSLQDAAVSADELRECCAKLEHGLGALLAGITDFQTFYTQEISPWTEAISTPAVEGIGPASTDVLQKYQKLHQVLQACSSIRAGYEKLSRSHLENASEKAVLVGLIASAPPVRTALNDRAAALKDFAGTGAQSMLSATTCL